MYLKQMGQVPLLTREQEVEISKRIEDAENEIKRIIYSFGFAGKEHIALAEKLVSEPPKERFDRVILDKKVDNRDAHLKVLRKLIKTVGRKQVVGRPFMYATTREFLERFGLNDLNDLPKVEEMSDVLGFELPNALLEPTVTTTALPFDGAPDDAAAPSEGAEPPPAQDDEEPAAVGSRDDTVH